MGVKLASGVGRLRQPWRDGARVRQFTESRRRPESSAEVYASSTATARRMHAAKRVGGSSSRSRAPHCEELKEGDVK
jgi:hypothetical protein